MGTLHPRRSHQLLPFFKNLRHRGYAAHLTLPYLASGSGKSLSKTLQSERMSPRTSSKRNISLALSVYENMPEEAHYSGSAERQCSGAPLSPPRWAGAAAERRKDEDCINPGWGMSPVEGSGIWAWLLGHEVLRDVS